jgi:hypothetical protein
MRLTEFIDTRRIGRSFDPVGIQDCPGTIQHCVTDPSLWALSGRAYENANSIEPLLSLHVVRLPLTVRRRHRALDRPSAQVRGTNFYYHSVLQRVGHPDQRSAPKT